MKSQTSSGDHNPRQSSITTLAAFKESERGQAIILIVFAFIALLGFVGLAIDGGMLYVERRQAQSVADSAALASARALCVGEDYVTAALASAAANGFNNDGVNNTVTIHRPPASGVYVGDWNSIEVIINSTATANFIQFVYPGALRVTNRAVSHCTPSYYGAAGGGNAIIALDPTASSSFFVNGNGDVIVTAGGIFVNSNNNTAMRLVGNSDVVADTVSVVGNWSKTPNASVTPTPLTGVAPITDPLESLQPPSQPPGSCTTLHLTGNDNNTINPGYYCSIKVSGNGDLIMNSGIYYIESGGFSISGNGDVIANNVMIYIKGGAFDLTGNGEFRVSAPTSGTYAGLMLFMDRSNNSTVKITGNGNSVSTGTFYAAASQITVRGNGDSTVLNSQIIGDTITTEGNGDLRVNYNPDQNVKIYVPPQIDLLE